MVLPHDNGLPPISKHVKTYLETLNWEALPHLPYSPDIGPFNYYLFRLTAHGLPVQ